MKIDIKVVHYELGETLYLARIMMKFVGWPFNLSVTPAAATFSIHYLSSLAACLNMYVVRLNAVDLNSDVRY